MLRCSRTVTTWLALPLLLTFVAGARAQSRALNPDDFVVREHDALLLDTPKLVTAGAEGHLSPTGDAVLYVDDGGAWVRPLLPVGKAVFQVAWERTQRDLRMAHAKQTGIGIMMFAADNQESLPAEGSDLQSLLARYSLKPGILDEFVYVFPGGKLKDIAEPSNTHLGYIPAPGGRVVLFVDGHVKFMPE